MASISLSIYQCPQEEVHVVEPLSELQVTVNGNPAAHFVYLEDLVRFSLLVESFSSASVWITDVRVCRPVTGSPYEECVLNLENSTCTFRGCRGVPNGALSYNADLMVNGSITTAARDYATFDAHFCKNEDDYSHPDCENCTYTNADDGFEIYFHGFGGSTLVVDILYQVLLECTNNNFRRRLLSEQNNGNRYMSVLEILP